jgi:hypothetical protein
MVLALVALCIGSLMGLALGRRPPASRRPWRAGPLLVSGVLLAGIGDHWRGAAGLGVEIAGYILLVGFALANHRHTGLLLIAAGLTTNLVVMAADGGMPVRGLYPAAAASGHHHGLSRDDHLTALADDMSLPGTDETVSPGDVVLALGGAVAILAWLEPGRRRRPLSRIGT